MLVGTAVAILATRRPVPRAWVFELALLNGVWVAGSVVYAALGGLSILGVVWDLVQAVLVGGFAAVQYWFVRRG